MEFDIQEIHHCNECEIYTMLITYATNHVLKSENSVMIDASSRGIGSLIYIHLDVEIPPHFEFSVTVECIYR